MQWPLCRLWTVLKKGVYQQWFSIVSSLWVFWKRTQRRTAKGIVLKFSFSFSFLRVWGCVLAIFDLFLGPDDRSVFWTTISLADQFFKGNIRFRGFYAESRSRMPRVMPAEVCGRIRVCHVQKCAIITTIIPLWPFCVHIQDEFLFSAHGLYK